MCSELIHEQIEEDEEGLQGLLGFGCSLDIHP